MPRSSLSPKSSKFLTLASVCIVIAGLYLAREVLIPLALAMLVTFLLAPLATKLERRGMGRIPAVITVVLLTLAVVGSIGYFIYGQVSDLAAEMPKYRVEIVERIRSIQSHFSGGAIEKVTDTVVAVAKETSSSTRPTTQATGTAAATATPGRETPVPVTIVPTEPGMNVLRELADTLAYLEPLATAFIVIIFVVFMLVQREDLRDKVIRLMGHGRLTVTTQALDEAATKVSRYLLAQSIVNGCFGLVITLGLFLLRIPDAPLWGLLCGLLRFIPYVGVWTGAAFPVLLALVAPAAKFPPIHELGHVAKPLATLGLFLATELATANILEPWLYGAHTGVSSIAILVAAIFWTWLWGGVGLLLSTPLTVCLAVIGKYVPHLGFLNILLGDQPVLAPHERFYQRLLADDPDDARDLLREFQKQCSLEEVYDTVLIPTLHMAERDVANDTLDEDRFALIQTSIKEMVEEMREEGEMDRQKKAAETTAAEAATGAAAPADGKPVAVRRMSLPKDCVVNAVILPANDLADEIVGIMLAHLMDDLGYCASAISQDKLASEMVESIAERKAEIVCVSALPPGSVAHSRYLCKRIYMKYPATRILVGLWTARGDLDRLKTRVASSGSVQIAGTLHDALDKIEQMIKGLLIRPPEPAATEREIAEVIP